MARIVLAILAVFVLGYILHQPILYAVAGLLVLVAVIWVFAERRRRHRASSRSSQQAQEADSSSLGIREKTSGWRNADQAVIDLAKLRDYCLNPEHPRGRHKARVFESALGFTQEDSEQVRAILLNAVLHGQATFSGADEYGQRYTMDIELRGPAGTAVVRTCWIIRSGEDFPRLTTCFVR